MKIIKLDRRHKAYKKYSFSHAIRFDSYWSSNAEFVAKYLEEIHKTPSYQRPDSVYSKGETNWYANFGHKSKGDCLRPYWIYLRNESDVTLLVLKGLLNDAKS